MADPVRQHPILPVLPSKSDSTNSADSRYTEWPELGNLDANLDDVFAKAEQRTHSRGIINIRRALASFIRSFL